MEIKAEEVIFKVSKKWFTTEPILVAPDLNKKIRMRINILDYAMESVLSMVCSNKQ